MLKRPEVNGGGWGSLCDRTLGITVAGERWSRMIEDLKCQAMILKELFEIFHSRVIGWWNLSKCTFQMQLFCHSPAQSHFLLEALLDHFPLLDLTLPFPNCADTNCSSPTVILTLSFYHLILGTQCSLFVCGVMGGGWREIFSPKIQSHILLLVCHTKLSTMWVLKE